MRKPKLKITYYQSKGLPQNEKGTIFCRVTCGRKLDFKFSTELKIEPKLFNAEKGRCEFPKQLIALLNDPKHGSNIRAMIDTSIDEKLSVLEQNVHDLQTICEMDNVEFNRVKVKQWLNTKRGNTIKPIKFSYFNEYVDSLVNDVSREVAPRLIVVRGESREAAKSTVSRYKLTFKRLKEYQEERKIKLTFTDVDRHFRSNFLQWLQGKGYTNSNTLYEHIKNIRRFARLAEFDGYVISPDIHSKEIFSTLKQKNVFDGEEIKDTYLTTEEQRVLLNLDLSKKPALENARDIFIILCQTGLRISDLKQNVITQLVGKTAKVPVKKTGGVIIVPVLPMVKEILDKRTPKSANRAILNRHIKTLCKDAGFVEQIAGYKLVGDKKKGEKIRKVKAMYPRYELISSHTGRRSFATNALKDGVSAALVCKITGHSTESMLYRYLKITPIESAEQFSAFYEKFSKTND